MLMKLICWEKEEIAWRQTEGPWDTTEIVRQSKHKENYVDDERRPNSWLEHFEFVAKLKYLQLQ
jgi:hypothetical protein